jgi:hypothetical protein
MESKKWKRFEELVKKVQEEMAPNAVVKLDDRIIGKETGVSRQIDISVRQLVGNYDILVVVDCKDYSIPVDVKDVESFIGLVKDVKANKGVIVAANGFTKTAKIRGEKSGLDLYTLLDTGEHDWQVLAFIPVLCHFVGPKKYSFSFSTNEEIIDFPFNKPQSLVLYDNNNKELGTVLDIMKMNWNNNKYPMEPGRYDNLELVNGITKVKSGNQFRELNAKLNLVIESRLYFGELPLKELSGFKDEITGRTITRGYITKDLDVEDVQKNWRRINSIEELAVKPLLTLEASDILDL